MPTEGTGIRITLICARRAIAATRRDSRQIGGTVRFAQVEGQSHCVSRSIGSPGEPGGGIRPC